MDRVRLEMSLTYLSVVIAGVLVFLSIVATADGIFFWDLLPPLMDKVAVLTMSSLCIIFGACVLLSLTLNLSIIAANLAALADSVGQDAAQPEA